MRKRIKIWILIVLGVAVFLAGWANLRQTIQRMVPPVTADQLARAARVEIIRDEWGVPHVHGQTDADTAFGLAYAHSEDDWPLIAGGIIAARGDLARLVLSEQAIGNDFYVRLFRVRAEAEELYETLAPDTRALLEGYAQGLNYYAALHPDEADGRFLPFTGIDLAATLIHKLPLFYRVDFALKRIMDDAPLEVGDPLPGPIRSDAPEAVTEQAGRAIHRDSTPVFLASNAHAVGRTRSADGIVRININSHQPWEGPVAWYEAHLSSDEGWNMEGGTFPGGPLIFHGHNENVAWAHTVNSPDLWDVYKLEMSDETHYIVDGETLELEVFEDAIRVELPWLEISVPRTFYRSIFGPTVVTDHGTYAIRYAGMGRLIGAIEQWYRMNRARNLDEWRTAMRIHAIPMFNTVYADSANIGYVYNALLPLRADGYDYTAVLPGNTRGALWNDYLPYDRLPRVENPPSGFVQNCNSTPFRTTTGPGNPQPQEYPANMGIDERMSNRALRSLHLFGDDAAITRAEFLRYKWDRHYEEDAPIYSEAIRPLLAEYQPRNQTERRALDMLRLWDGNTDEESPIAALALLTWRPIWHARIVDRAIEIPAPALCFQDAMQFLLSNYGRFDVPLGEVQRLVRGDVNIGVGGGADVLNAVHGTIDGDIYRGWAGDSYILIVEFQPEGPRSWSLHQYGNVNREGSPHYSDQALLFQRRQLRPTLFYREDLLDRVESRYRPGNEIDPL